ncbi:AAA domain-containing protein [Gordonia sp. GONU]|uniref:AAA domain-containing protein n=1 Tax=Gordonia sp. GONU TaxID=2972949 RepID=UPI0021ABBA54|nr:AAA domain-containing protein [Gordonia sp. GONU]MCR8897184.1 AAA domain-containing protein [Gordonia sp. GONU]
MASRENDVDLKDRVGRLMQFLREMVKARTRPVLKVEDHEEHHWLFPGRTPFQVDQAATAGDVVVRAPRVHLEEPPELPRELLTWVDDPAAADRSESYGPQFREPGQDASVPEAEVVRARAKYLRWYVQWTGWAQTDRQRRPHHELYQALTDMMHELTARPDSVELVVGSGLLSLPSKLADGSRVNTHLVTQAATIERDETTGDLLVRFVELSSCRLEDSELLTGYEIFDQSGSRTLLAQLRESSSPLDESIQVFLKTWAARALGLEIPVTDELEPPTTIGEVSLALAPALVLRKRGAFALVEYYNQMINQAEEASAKTPLGLAQLVAAIEADERVAWLESTGATAPSELAEDPLFPLPANAEQSKIIERLGGDSGVVVEGPPGTGKTHTIANLMSALLARGQRVLVTSEKSQALQVLRDKLPADMQELCVSITDLARGGSQELNRSVATIAERKTSFIPEASERTIADLTDKREQALARRSTILESIRALRESETYQHPEVAPGYSGTLASIVRRLEEQRERHAWLPGPLYAAEPPLGPGEFRELVRLLELQTPEHGTRAEQMLPALDSLLPSADRMTSLFDAVHRPPLDLPAQTQDLVDIIESVDSGTAEQVLLQCGTLREAVDIVRALPMDYRQLANRVLAGEIDHLWARVPELDTLVEGATRCDRAVGSVAVDAPGVSRRVLQTIEAWFARLQDGAEWKGRFRRSAEQKAYDELELNLIVDGDPVRRAEELEIVVAHLKGLDAVESARRILADLGVHLADDSSRTSQVNNLVILRRHLASIERLVASCRALTDTLYQSTRRHLAVRSVDDADTLSQAASAITFELQRRSARQELSAITDVLGNAFGPAPAPEARELTESVRAASAHQFGEALSAYLRAQQQQREYHECQALVQRVRTAAPSLLDELQGHLSDPGLGARVDTIDEAWHWRRAYEWVQQQRTPGREAQLSSELDAATSDISSLTARLAAERAWKSALERMSATEVTALQAYRDHIRSIGKGTGKHAERFRQAARMAMQEAQSAVPAWVMPTQQVLASIPPQPGAFDVVIVDEASQVDITNLYLLWLAPRVIVVGDDKQCTPSEVALGGLDDVFTRLDNYLGDLPDHVRNTFTPRSSLFSLLRSRFGQVVRLREHFRSMPEIISWSSNQFYRDAPLVPVRQFGSDRLPPLKSTYVAGATVTGKFATLTNRAEAEAIADQVRACLDDPQYDGKTMGVVVLQGQGQVTAIQNALRGNISEDEWDERRFRVGTPPDFQGDERDVIFLSLVVAPDQNFQSLTRTEFEQRFNVGASRAKDQMWLFHSVTLDRLRTGDLRKSLLEHMTTRTVATTEPVPENVPNDVRDPRFDSLFEQRVFNEIVARGYHVNPQIPVNNRRIDLVVTGSASRLAVECDGDAFHTTPEQLREDLEREIELRRCGWTFWRVRESEFYADRIEAMSSLWTELDRLGIEPGLQHSNDPSTVSTVIGRGGSGLDNPTDIEPPVPPIENRGDEPDDGARSRTTPVETVVERTSPSIEPKPIVEQTLPSETDCVRISDEALREAIVSGAPNYRSMKARELAAQFQVPESQIEGVLRDLFAESAKNRQDAPEYNPGVNARDDLLRRAASDSEIENENATPAAFPVQATLRKVLVAAAWPSVPLTIDRACHISKLDESATRDVLDALVEDGQLDEMTKAGTMLWVRSYGAKV